MTERPNKELADRYYSDDTLKAWWWYEDANRWAEDKHPDFDPDYVWRVGHEAPTEPPVKMCELAGVKFPMPMREAPAVGSGYWYAGVDGPSRITWRADNDDLRWLGQGVCQATHEGAIAQGRAMAAALKLAIEGAK